MKKPNQPAPGDVEVTEKETIFYGDNTNMVLPHPEGYKPTVGYMPKPTETGYHTATVRAEDSAEIVRLGEEGYEVKVTFTVPYGGAHVIMQKMYYK